MMVLQLPAAVLAAAGVVCVFLLVLFSVIIVKAFEIRHKKVLFPVAFVLFAGSLLALMVFALSCSVRFSQMPVEEAAWLQRLPAMPMLTAPVLLTVSGAVLAAVLYGSLSTELTPASLMEGLDMLPDGICYSTAEGIPLLVNRKMQQISRTAFSTAVTDTAVLQRRLTEGDVAEGCSVTGMNESRFLHLPDGSIWNMVAHDLVIKKRKIREVIAYEVTEEYRKSMALEERTRHLAEVNKQLRDYSNNLDAIIREREILSAKIRLHDDVGRSLLALRAYLAQQNVNREQLVALWKFTVAVLRREAVSAGGEDRMEVLKQAAEAVDVRLVLDGEIPEQPQLNKAIALAVHECLTNTVKHADGSVLTVKTRERDGIYTVEITNDGRQPKEEITERGGLRNLRTTVEMSGGTMEIQSKPQFLLRLQLRMKQ